MKFDELDTQLRQYETALDDYISLDDYLIVRLDGRGFTKKTNETWQLQRPFDLHFHELMVQTCQHLMDCGFNIIYAYTQSDEISLLFHPNEQSFKRKTRKIISLLAGEASACFSVNMGNIASFDARICPLPTIDIVLDYFSWRQEDAHRNGLNTHCYWLQRQNNISATNAQHFLVDKTLEQKYQFLAEHGIDFHQVAHWQKYGTGLYYHDAVKQGVNPKTGEITQTTRRVLSIDEQLPTQHNYRTWLQALILSRY